MDKDALKEILLAVRDEYDGGQLSANSNEILKRVWDLAEDYYMLGRYG